MVLIIAMIAFLLVTVLFILDTAKDQTTTSEVSTYLSPFESGTFVRHNYAASVDSVWRAISNLSDYNYWFPGVGRILPVIDSDRYVHRYSFDQFIFAPGSLLRIKPKGPFPSGKAMIASVVPNKKLEMVMQYNPLHKEYVSFDLNTHSEGTTLSCTRKSYGPFSFMSVWGFDSNKSKILDNLGYLIPEEEFKSDSKTTKEATSSDSSTDNIFADRNQMAAYLVNKTLDGDSNIIKATNDVYARGKAKALLIKINKGIAERPAMPEAGEAAPVTPDNSATSYNKPQATPTQSPEDIIATVVNQALDGDDAPLKALEDKVLRAKSKSLIMKINKGIAERPAMPEAGEAIEQESSHSNEQIEKDDGSDNTQDDLFIKLVEEGVKGNMDEINGLEDKVLRGKIKAAIVKAKRSS